MESIKPLLVQWCYESWDTLKSNPELINKGWYYCVTKYADPFNEAIQNKACEEIHQHTLESYRFVPTEDEPDNTIEDNNDSDEDGLELDLMVNGTRTRNDIRRFGYGIDTSAIDLSDSDD